MKDNRIVDLLLDAAREIRKSQDANRWIPVSERLPLGDSYATDGSLLLWQDHGDGCGSQIVGYFIKDEFWLYEDDNIPASEAGVTITHWRQLPPNPEGTTGCR